MIWYQKYTGPCVWTMDRVSIRIESVVVVSERGENGSSTVFDYAPRIPALAKLFRNPLPLPVRPCEIDFGVTVNERAFSPEF